MSISTYLRANWLILVLGVILYAIGTSMLIWNEGRAVRKALSLDEALGNVVTVNAEVPVDASNEGRLVHIVGEVMAGEPLTEPDYGIQVLAVKLRRRVQMYQWVEETVEYKFGESMATVQTEDRTYYYTMEWKDRLIDSSSFYIRHGHRNPTKFPIESRIHIADHVNIGYYELDSEVKYKFDRFIELTSDSRPDDPSIKLHSGLYYHCNDVWNPEIGDLRIQFSFAGLEGTRFTVIGKQQNGKVVPYQTSVQIPVLIVLEGEHTLTNAFTSAHYTHKLTTWSYRFVGWLLLFFSVTCLSGLLHILLSSRQILQLFAPNPAHPVSGNFLLSLSLALLITAIGWISHRPWLGFGMIMAAISPFLFCARGVIQYQRLA